MTSVQLEHISKRFGSTLALDGIDLQIAPGELFFLLGPSGCGKSTLLRIVAGLLQPTTGRILFNDRDVTPLGTERRSAVMCFQNYALWPHMTVRENVDFGPSLQGPADNARRQRVDQVLRLVQLDRYAESKPNALSGGQQQRAALARALAVQPKCLLLDEPLSNLDAKLRLEMRGEIRRICKSSGCTTIYVTHDQKEALSIADRIVLLKDGLIAQVGSPTQLYYTPRTSFVADFIGQANLLTASILAENPEGITVRTPVGTLRGAACPDPTPRAVTVSIRPERIRILGPNSPRSPDANHLPAKLVETTFLGESSEHAVEIDGHRLRVNCSPPLLDATGEIVLEIDIRDCLVLPE
ncbi:MAG: ABC transporter ATP-binding protein [Tepidisphaeraceae bacterium]